MDAYSERLAYQLIAICFLPWCQMDLPILPFCLSSFLLSFYGLNSDGK
ncbi:hypothetical protein SLEP1_g16929 [Rubroshorea leprosula]|uniref:Uncharacterized protein n=1 Tax=Rubroshorea leprosula TaxID=152421 RepID=A0AAV5ISG7_9ROSI|nr:hypothetical protein SLEP1_g16929 [Rubroshorea leprosula]